MSAIIIKFRSNSLKNLEGIPRKTVKKNVRNIKTLTRNYISERQKSNFKGRNEIITNKLIYKKNNIQNSIQIVTQEI